MLITVKERIENRIVKDVSGCWLWQGHLRDGYGQVSVLGKPKAVHRIYWELINGTIPEGILVCHRCDVRNCINPSHLFLGTVKENMQDKIKKGRDHNKSKTKCKLGHLFNKKNTYVYIHNNRKSRICRICRKQKQAAWRITHG